MYLFVIFRCPVENIGTALTSKYVVFKRAKESYSHDMELYVFHFYA